MANPAIAKNHGSEKRKHGYYHCKSYSLTLIQEWDIEKSMATWDTQSRHGPRMNSVCEKTS